MIKKKIIDGVRNIIGYKYDRRQVSWAIDLAYRQYIYDLMQMKERNYDFLIKEYQNQTVSYDSTKEVHYIDLPAAVVGLPTKEEGVIHINTATGADLDYYPMTIDDLEYSGGLDSSVVETHTGYMVVGNRIEFYNFNSAITKLNLDLAISFDDFDMTDDIVMPGGKDYDIVQAAINMLLQKRPMEKSDKYEQ